MAEVAALNGAAGLHGGGEIYTHGRSTPTIGVHIVAGPSQPPSNLASGASVHGASEEDYDWALRPIPQPILDELPRQSRSVLESFAACPLPEKQAE